MHYMVRGLILVMLSQILRPHGATLGADLSPATDRPEFVTALHSLLSIRILRLPRTLSARIWRRSRWIFAWCRWMRF